MENDPKTCPPIVLQPYCSGAPMAGVLPGCPPGLQFLTTVDQLFIMQKVELVEAFTGFETKNKYRVFNSLGQQILFAKEDTDCCTRQCCGASRPFDLTITDIQGQEVIHLYRPLRCCLEELEVSSPPGTVIGKVDQKWSFCPKFVIKDQLGEPVLRIEGPWCTDSDCCGDVEFRVVDVQTGEQVGLVTKQWSGMAKEVFTDADNFGISFPLDLDVKVKATLLGALFLIDYMYYEDPEQTYDYRYRY